MPKLTRVQVISGAANNKVTKNARGEEVNRTIDGKDHSSNRVLPFLHTEEDSKSYLKNCMEFLAINKAITEGEDVVVVRGDGSETAPVKPQEGNVANQKDGAKLVPNHDLPTTFADLATLINAGLKTLHVQQVNALMAKAYVAKDAETKAGKSDAAGKVDEKFDF